jgi:hypothetical protein
VIEDGTADMIANGALVEVEGKLSGGILSATKVEIEHVTVITLDGTVPSVQGTISSFVSVANFIVAGQQINAGTASFVGGSSANLGNGVRVSVAGTVSNGVLNATTVQFLSSPGPSTVTVTGAISGFISVSNFTIAGQRIDASSASFSNGNASNLANGRSVTVTGTVQSGTANRRSQRLQSRRRPRGDRSAARSASLRSSPPSSGATIRSSSMPGRSRGPPCRSRSFARRQPSSRSPSNSTTVRRCFRKCASRASRTSR